MDVFKHPFLQTRQDHRAACFHLCTLHVPSTVATGTQSCARSATCTCTAAIAVSGGQTGQLGGRKLLLGQRDILQLGLVGIRKTQNRLIQELDVRQNRILLQARVHLPGELNAAHFPLVAGDVALLAMLLGCLEVKLVRQMVALEPAEERLPGFAFGGFYKQQAVHGARDGSVEHLQLGLQLGVLELLVLHGHVCIWIFGKQCLPGLGIGRTELAEEIQYHNVGELQTLGSSDAHHYVAQVQNAIFCLRRGGCGGCDCRRGCVNSGGAGTFFCVEQLQGHRLRARFGLTFSLPFSFESCCERTLCSRMSAALQPGRAVWRQHRHSLA
mmetsp:Transcript_54791/g.95808  ORF Transcript_54791/g.95808 Transcript_54791/m.95808 type:complete len:327 (-) Transcript_54791:2719-3699(-)